MKAPPLPHEFGGLRIERIADGWVISGPAAFAESPLVPLAELRGWVRTEADGRYRPLSGARTLRPGWRCRVKSAADAVRAIEAVYPLAMTHRRQLQDGQLRVVPLDEVLRRQTGRYEAAAGLSPRGRELARLALCGRCVRVPVWAGEPASFDEIPCPEPCNVMVALCREAAAWERDRPSAAPVEPAVPFAAFDQPGNDVREAWLAAAGAAAIDAAPSPGRDSTDG